MPVDITVSEQSLHPFFNSGERKCLRAWADDLAQEIIDYIVANPSALGLSLDELTDVTAPSPVDQDVLTWDSTSSKWVNETVPRNLDGLSDVTITSAQSAQALRYNGSAWVNSYPTESIIIACSDKTTALTTGTAKVTFRMPYAFTLTAVRASVTTAPTGSTLVVDINEDTGSGATSILSTKLSIDVSEKTSTTAATPPVISDSSLADDAEITIDIDQIGSTVAGAGLKVYLIGYRT